MQEKSCPYLMINDEQAGTAPERQERSPDRTPAVLVQGLPCTSPPLSNRGVQKHQETVANRQKTLMPSGFTTKTRYVN